MRTGRTLTLLAGLALVASVSLAEDKPAHSRYVFDDATTVVAFGDLHGTYEHFVNALKGMALVDDDLSWTGAGTHLVLNGDLLDRGPRERDLLDLVMRLEYEAYEAGGRVHVLLGNHEVMNIARDLRYVPKKGFADFAKGEKAKDRRAARRAWAKRQGLTSPTEAQKAFDASYPPGYFARLRAFSRDGHYGSWLLDKPLVIKVAGLLFVHGGLTEDVASLGIDGINERGHAQLNAILDAFETLERAGIFLPTTDYTQALQLTHRFLAPATNHPLRERQKLRLAATVILRSTETLPFAADGPIWYRGNSLESERIERERLEQVLELLDARAMLVGHTPTGPAAITSRFEGKLFRLDVGTTYGNAIQALVLNPQGQMIFDPRVRRYRDVLIEGPGGETWARGHEELLDTQIETFLEDAEVRRRRPVGRGSTRPELVQLERGALRLRGIFKSVEEAPTQGEDCVAEPADRFLHEVAAYEIDRLIGLQMVPVTVRRTIAEQDGSLQLWVEEAVDQRAMDAYNLVARDPERVERLRAHVPVFDALIGNHGRRDSDLLYDLENSRLLLIDHSKAFCIADDIASILGDVDCPIDPAIRESIAAIDAAALREVAGGLLTGEQRSSILARRDRILETCAGSAGE